MAVKSLAYLAGFSGLGYVLYVAVTPEEGDIKKHLPEGQVHHQVEEQKTRASFGSVIKLAAEGKSPLYLKSKEEIEAEVRAVKK